MSSTPWAVSKRKRGTPTSVPPTRKRPRSGDTPASTTRQQTLTQAQWVTSAPPSFVDDADLTPIENMPRRNPGRKILKRDSTLTQMDFFNHAMAREEDMNDALLPIPEDESEQLPHMPQLDGIYETPKKPRKRKSSLTEFQETSSKKARQSQGSRDYRPSSRRSNISDTKEDAQPRRTSGRIAQRATILSDPADNLEYFEKALSRSPIKGSSRPRELEIQDSPGNEEGIEQLPTQSQPISWSHHPLTPRKQRPIVLSSQSPVSISPNKRWTAPNTDIELRSLLRDRSVNVPTAPHPTPLSEDGTGSRPTSSRSVNSNTLKKKPRKPKTRVEDSQANLWSFPESSSAQKKQASQLKAVVNDAEATLPELDGLGVPPNEPASLEIPSTSQIVDPISNQSAGEDQDILSSLYKLTGVAEAITDTVKRIDVNDNAASERVITRDFAEVSPAEARACQQGVPEHNEAPERMLMDDANEIGDSESEFGSPIANDTQFNFDLEHRTSSPSRIPSQHQESNDNPTTGSKGSALVRNNSTSSLDEPPTQGSAPLPQPTPRLVQRSSPQVNTASLQQEESGSDEFLLPRLARHGASITQTSVTRVPLNDVHPSSSPVLPLTKSITQRSVYPASLPRPSQISTQEATQGYLGQSSMIGQDQETETPLRTDRITIKDSNSIRVPLSQVPLHIASQLEPGVGLEVGDFENDEADYDLDPPSSEPPRLVTKDLPRKENPPTGVLEVSPQASLPKPTALPPLANKQRKSPSRAEPTQPPDIRQPPPHLNHPLNQRKPPNPLHQSTLLFPASIMKLNQTSRRTDM